MWVRKSHIFLFALKYFLMFVEEDNILSKKMPQTLGLFVIEISLLPQVQNRTEDKLFFAFFDSRLETMHFLSSKTIGKSNPRSVNSSH